MTNNTSVRKMPQIDRGGFALNKLNNTNYRTEVYLWYSVLKCVWFLVKKLKNT